MAAEERFLEDRADDVSGSNRCSGSGPGKPAAIISGVFRHPAESEE